ncbi:hypothetical protein HGRIS_014641 [Hohenbuehelia grisea]|uniref:Carboxylic ester hydrolase n=1 Tax=Hohenbuehelia grisea TaxID=104357 RepID=A0ABR3JV30_9AGAR
MLKLWSPLLLGGLFAQQVLSSASSPGAVISSHEGVVDLGYAKYRGKRSNSDTWVFYGLPYAEPPLGDRRFRAPQALNITRVSTAYNGTIVDATRQPDFCVQDLGAGSEDCLKVNVYTPANVKKGSKLPVLCYIHGGGWSYGVPTAWPFDHWVQQSPNVIIVSVYYRLASLGFLATPEFYNSTEGVFNAGLQDQFEALNWVQRNIGAFGGDPRRVTLNGESAGATSVLHFMAPHINVEQRLFSKAIVQSGVRLHMGKADEMAPSFQFYATQAGCGEGDLKKKMKCLREAKLEALTKANKALMLDPTSPGMIFTPVFEAPVFHPRNSVDFPRIPVIVGATTNDTVFDGDLVPSLKSAMPRLTANEIQAIEEYYPPSAFESERHRTRNVLGEFMFFCSRVFIGKGYKNNSWTFRYNQQEPDSRWPQEPGQVGHASDNYMMFNGSRTFDNGEYHFSGLNTTQTAFAQEIIAYWLSFVRSGDPNKFKLPRSPVWKPFRHGNARLVLQQGPDEDLAQSGLLHERELKEERERCAFVGTIRPDTVGGILGLID